jgi:hypothetical protein
MKIGGSSRRVIPIILNRRQGQPLVIQQEVRKLVQACFKASLDSRCCAWLDPPDTHEVIQKHPNMTANIGGHILGLVLSSKLLGLAESLIDETHGKFEEPTCIDGFATVQKPTETLDGVETMRNSPVRIALRPHPIDISGGLTGKWKAQTPSQDILT